MPSLLIRQGPLAGKQLEVDADIVLGRRHNERGIEIDDPEMSRRHAVVRQGLAGLEIADLGSANGTWVNGARITAPVQLEGGDLVRIGQTVLEVQGVRGSAQTVADEGAAAGGWEAPAASPDGAAVVQAVDVTRRYGDGETAVDALRGVSLDILRGRLTAVMGPSGSGKSTLMHILAGLDRPTAGAVTIDGTEITQLDDTALTKLRRERVGFIFQFFNLLPTLTAEENILLPLSIAGQKPDRGLLDEMIQRVGLADRRRHRPAELSGGQQQRVAILRAFVSRPAVVFADEPTGNLDSTSSAEILAIMRESVDTYGQSTVMVTHDPKAAATADRILFLADGLIVKVLGRSTAHEVLDAMDELTAR